jgi:nitrile hydratase
MSHTHDHDHPPPQPDHPEPKTYHQFLGLALNQLLIERGLYDATELHQMIESIEAVDASTHGAKVVVRAWTDAEFKRALLEHPNEAIERIGLDAGSSELKVLENTDSLHNVVVCTLCSCYPRALLGRPPLWYKAREYRSRMVVEPRTVLKEFGTSIPQDVEVRVHDSTAELRFLVIPKQPAASHGLDQDALTELVTRDSMIGVTVL